MAWDQSLLDGPIPSYQFLGLDENGAPLFGDPLPVYNLNIAAQVIAADEILAAELEPFVVEPATPKRVFAGDDPANRVNTVCLSFASEAEARTHLAAFWTEPT